jgi:hypothetical protein
LYHIVPGHAATAGPFFIVRLKAERKKSSKKSDGIFLTRGSGTAG